MTRSIGNARALASSFLFLNSPRSERERSVFLVQHCIDIQHSSFARYQVMKSGFVLDKGKKRTSNTFTGNNRYLVYCSMPRRVVRQVERYAAWTVLWYQTVDQCKYPICPSTCRLGIPRLKACIIAEVNIDRAGALNKEYSWARSE